MKETGIIMSGDHPRLVLEGTKTMTRRTYGLEFINKSPESWEYVWDSICQQHRFYDKYYKDAPPIIVKCPYGGIGDRLWVREAMFSHAFGGSDVEFAYFKADRLIVQPDKTTALKWQWKPKGLSARFMPKWAARIWLEITGIRAERLQDITDDDAIDEGFISTIIETAYGSGYRAIYGRDSFAEYWDSLNAKRGYPWSMNPWVWPIEYRRLQP